MDYHLIDTLTNLLVSISHQNLLKEHKTMISARMYNIFNSTPKSK